MGENHTTLDWIAGILLIVGGLNWGLWGLFRLDLVNAVLGSIVIVQDIVYVLVGISGLYVLVKMLTKKK